MLTNKQVVNIVNDAIDEGEIEVGGGTKLYKHVFTDTNANQITFISNNETYDFSTNGGRNKFRDDLMVFGGIIFLDKDNSVGQVMAVSGLSASQIDIYFWSVADESNISVTIPFAGIRVETTIL
jgi:hypothetical protein